MMGINVLGDKRIVFECMGDGDRRKDGIVKGVGIVDVMGGGGKYGRVRNGEEWDSKKRWRRNDRKWQGV